MNQDNSQLNAAETSGNSPPTTLAPEKHHYIAEGFKNRTKGEAVFNLGSYIGIGYVGVTAVSVGMTGLLKHVPFFAKRFNAIGETVAKHTKMSSDSAGQLMTISAMFLGGTIMSVLPVKWLEDHKFKLVQWLDKKIYGEDRIAHDPQIQQAHQEMEAVPEQTWKSVALARVSSFVATYSTLLAIGANESPLARKFGHSIESIGIKGGRAIDAHLNQGKNEVLRQISETSRLSPITPNIKHDRVPSLMWNYLVQDAIYTLITSVSLFSFTRVFAPLFAKPDEPPAPFITSHVPTAIPTLIHTPMTQASTSKTPQLQVAQASAQGRLLENAVQLGQ